MKIHEAKFTAKTNKCVGLQHNEDKSAWRKLFRKLMGSILRDKLNLKTLCVLYGKTRRLVALNDLVLHFPIGWQLSPSFIPFCTTTKRESVYLIHILLTR